MKRDYLTLGDVLAIHADQIATYRGAGGIRDPGQLDAALFRPQTGYYADIIAEAAALWESLSQNHPVVDGSKRTAFAAMFTFLSINGVDITADADHAWASCLVSIRKANSTSPPSRHGSATTRDRVCEPVRLSTAHRPRFRLAFAGQQGTAGSTAAPAPPSSIA